MVAEHCVCFPCACWPICKHCCVFAIDYCFYQRFNCFTIYKLRIFIAIDLVESVALLFGTMQHLQDLFIFSFELFLDRVEDYLHQKTVTIRLSCVLITSQSPELIYLLLKGRTRIATKIFDSPSELSLDFHSPLSFGFTYMCCLMFKLNRLYLIYQTDIFYQGDSPAFTH